MSVGVYVITNHRDENKTPLVTNGSTVIPPKAPVTPKPADNPTLNITSVEFNVSDTEPIQAIVIGHKTSYYAKNIGSPNLMVRSQYQTYTGWHIIIINGAQKDAWDYRNGHWESYHSSLVSYSNLYQGPIQYYTDAIVANWTGSGNYIYTFYTIGGSASVTLSDIIINPVLPDSFFEPDS